MDDQPPKCFLGCCNVRSWTLAVFIISIVFLILGIATYITLLTDSPENAVFGIIINLIFIYINIRLRLAVLKYNIAPLLVWLWIYSIIYILFIIVEIADVIVYIGGQDIFDTKTQQLLTMKIILTATYGVFGVLFFIPVYQYYNYEKKSSLINVIHAAAVYQTV